MMAEEKGYTFGPFQLDVVREQLWRGNEEIRLAPKVFAVLRYLVEHRGEIVSKNALLDSIWSDLHVTDTVLAVHIGKAREALDDDPKKPNFIETVHRRGYRFIAVCSSSPQTPLNDYTSEDRPLTRPIINEPATTIGARPLVGREAELSLLREKLDAALSGTGSVVFISGPAGIGKTRLTREVRDWVLKSGCQWLEGRYDRAASHPHQAWAEMIATYLQQAAGEALESLEVIDRQQLVKLVPEIEPMAKPSESTRSDPDAERLRLFKAVTHFFVGISQKTPMVLCIDDLQWATSIELVHHLARNIGNQSMLILATHRDDEVKGNPSLWGAILAMNRERLFHSLPLESLGVGEVEKLISSRFDEVVAARLASSVYKKTAGNPFFVEEFLHLLQERGVVFVSESGWQVTDPDSLETPDSVKAVINQRIERLGEDTQNLLRIASVVGRKFPLRLLAKLTGHGEEFVVDALDEGERAKVVFPVQQLGEEVYSFVHDLTQETLYESIGSARRRRHHKRIGQAIEELYTDGLQEHYSELAHHYGYSGDAEKAVDYSRIAGEQALQRSAYEDAIGHLTTALELLKSFPDTPERAQRELTLLIDLGKALMATTGQGVPEVKKVYMRVRELCPRVGESSQVFSALRGLARFHMNQAELRTVREIAEQLVGLAGSEENPTRLLDAQRTLGLVSFHMGEFAPARTLLERSMALYDPQQPHDFVSYPIDPNAMSLASLSHILWALGYPEKAFASSQEAIALAQQLSHPYTLAFVNRHHMWFHQQYRQDVQRAQEWADAVIALCNEQGMPYFLAQGIITRGWVLTKHGEIEEGLALIHEGLASRVVTGNLLFHPYLLSILADAQGTAGQIEEALNTLAEAFHAVDKTEERSCESDLHRMKGELLLQSKIQGSQSDPEFCFRRAVDVARRQRAKSLELRGIISLSRLLHKQKKTHEARQMLAEIYGWFTEGFDFPDLKEARALLDELA